MDITELLANLNTMADQVVEAHSSHCASLAGAATQAREAIGFTLKIRDLGATGAQLLELLAPMDRVVASLEMLRDQLDRTVAELRELLGPKGS